MSSVVIWRDEATGVTASWNKEGLHSVFVPLRIDEHGICDGLTTEWRGENAAIRAAKSAAKKRLEEMSSENPDCKRFRIASEGHPRVNSEPEVRNLDWFRDGQRFDTAVFAAIAMLPVAGTVRTMLDGSPIMVQRVE